MNEKFCSSCGEQFKSSEQKFCGMCGTPTPFKSESKVSNKVEEDLSRSEIDSLPGFNPLDRVFERQEFPDFSEGTFSFRHANLMLVQAAARNWFPGEMKSASVLAESIESNSRPEWISDFEINQWFLDGAEFFSEYESIEWNQSELGLRFLRALDARGVVYSQGTLGVRVEVDLPEGGTQTLPISTQIHLVSGKWALSDGTPYLQKGEVFRSKKTGRDIVYWNIDALASTRPRTNQANIAFSNQILIPHLLQVATYLAETAFPSAITGSMGMTKRETSFGEDAQNIARPVTRFQKDGRIIGLYSDAIQSQSIAIWAPEHWQHGYVFDDTMSQSQIFDQLPTVCDGLPKIADILVDGYCNWTPGSELDFQVSVWSDYALCSNGDYFQNGSIVPGVLYWELAERSNARYDQAYNHLKKASSTGNTAQWDEALDALLVLAQEGVGPIFLHAGNSWAASGMELYEDFNCAPVMEFFASIDVDSQGINALSNLIVSYLDRGLYKEAEPMLDAAIIATQRIGPNLETHSHFHNLDGSIEAPIYIEIFESGLKLKRELGKKGQEREIAEKAIAYCEKFAADSELMQKARAVLS